jgi:hypothetical protein
MGLLANLALLPKRAPKGRAVSLFVAPLSEMVITLGFSRVSIKVCPARQPSPSNGFLSEYSCCPARDWVKASPRWTASEGMSCSDRPLRSPPHFFRCVFC